MTRSKKLQRISELAKSDELLAGRKLNDLHSELARQTDQLGQLMKYHQDYSDRLDHQGSAGISCAQLRNLNVFINNIDQAIDRQNKNMEFAQHSLDMGHQHWLHQHRRFKSLEKASEKQRLQENSLLRRREQHELEELSSRSNRDSAMEKI